MHHPGPAFSLASIRRKAVKPARPTRPNQRLLAAPRRLVAEVPARGPVVGQGADAVMVADDG